MFKTSFSFVVCALATFGVFSRLAAQENPIVFVTQVPIPSDFTNMVATFGNHLPSLSSAPRGGDLWIRYPDGTTKNLTAAAGFGEPAGQQGANAIAVRDPAVSWDGQRVMFSMVIGAPTRRFELGDYRWQLYEISGLGPDDTPVITKVPNQPEQFNNHSPCYGTDGRIIFTSDRPRDAAGSVHLYPQLDEYEETPTVTGLWSLDPETGDLFLMEHSPSGSFSPIVDSFGRVIFTRWDHMQRDQQADADANNGSPGGIYGTFDFSDESAAAERLFGVREENFPDPTGFRPEQLGDNLVGLRFNFFFPWMINEDGTEMETLNHVGRHELHVFFARNRTDDPDVIDFTAPNGRTNPNDIENMFHIREDPTQPGLFIGVDAPEFQTHTSGMIFSLTGAPDDNPDDMVVEFLTHEDTRDASNNPGPTHSGFYRNPLPTTDGHLIAAHTSETRADRNAGTAAAPQTLHQYRIKRLEQNQDGYFVPAENLTSGISKMVTWWSPDFIITHDAELWELQPVELVARQLPVSNRTEVPEQERQVIAESGESLESLKEYLASQDLALLVMRDLRTRDDADEQQPYQLRLEGGEDPPGSEGERVYDIKYLQFFQGDQVRGIGLRTPDGNPRQGRRVLAREMHEGSPLNQTTDDAPPGSVLIGDDGSAAAIVPARRALSWQLTDGEGTPVVRERYWLSFQPGEVRSCTSCHGLNKIGHGGNGPPQNYPEALRTLLEAWTNRPPIQATLDDVGWDETGALRLLISGVSGQRVRLERSSNLRDWIDSGEVTLNAASHEHLIPANEVSAAQTFFRLAR